MNNVYLIVALVATSFAAGRFYADGSLVEENRKLTESLRFLRGEKLGYAHEKPGGGPWRDERRPTAVAVAPAAASGREPEAQPTSPGAAPVAVAASAAAPAAVAATPTATPAAAVEKPRAETVAQDAPPRNAAVSQPGPVPARAPDRPEPAPAPAVAKGGKAGKTWVADLGDNVQATATYWHCNNATLAASGMEYYAYGSVPVSRLKQPGDAYSVRDGRAIVISGCWSPARGKAILYRKRDGLRWEPPFDVGNGSWVPG